MQAYFSFSKRGYFTNLITLCKDMGGKGLRRKVKTGQEKQRRPNASIRAEIVQ